MDTLLVCPDCGHFQLQITQQRYMATSGDMLDSPEPRIRTEAICQECGWKNHAENPSVLPPPGTHLSSE